jgi:uncharacterized delta-60 repeat protein
MFEFPFFARRFDGSLLFRRQIITAICLMIGFCFLGTVSYGQEGGLDPSYAVGLSGVDSTLQVMARQSDGRVVIGGDFITVNGVNRFRIARLNANGSLDTSFGAGQTGADDFVNVMAIQPDGRILIGGNFTTVNNVGRRFVARLNANGSLDTTFGANLPFLNNRVFSMALQSDGKILIGGTFNTVNNVAPGGIIRLNSDGTLDTTFDAGLNLGTFSGTFAIAVQSDGRILIGGEFTGVNGVTRGSLARLNADGSVDTTFGNGIAVAGNRFPDVSDIVIQPDGRILVAGGFTSVNGVARSAIARLNSNGTLDTTFGNGLSGVSGTVEKIARRSDGQIFIVGDFSAVNGVFRGCIARLNADGSTDLAFGQGLSGTTGRINDVLIQPTDGRVLIGGIFIQFNGVARGRITRLIADCPTITVSPTTIPSGVSGTFYSQTFTQTGVVGTPVFSLTGTLPAGLSFDPATATLSGTPTQTGVFGGIVVTATDPNGCAGSQSFALQIDTPPGIPEPINDRVTLAVTGQSLLPASCPDYAGQLVLTATLTNTGSLPIDNPYFEVVELRETGGVPPAIPFQLVSADGAACGTGGLVGARQSVSSAPFTLQPGQSVTVTFRIELPQVRRFRFLLTTLGVLPTQGFVRGNRGQSRKPFQLLS